jgi:hypothetical protein
MNADTCPDCKTTPKLPGAAMCYECREKALLACGATFRYRPRARKVQAEELDGKSMYMRGWMYGAPQRVFTGRAA